MEKLVILPMLLLFVGFIFFSLVRNRKREGKEHLAKTLSFDPLSEVKPIQVSDSPHDSCTLAITLRIVGVVNVFSALIIGPVLADDFGWIISIAAILSGCLGCLFCYALAKCVDAADKYLNNH